MVSEATRGMPQIAASTARRSTVRRARSSEDGVWANADVTRAMIVGADRSHLFMLHLLSLCRAECHMSNPTLRTEIGYQVKPRELDREKSMRFDAESLQRLLLSPSCASLSSWQTHRWGKYQPGPKYGLEDRIFRHKIGLFVLWELTSDRCEVATRRLSGSCRCAAQAVARHRRDERRLSIHGTTHLRPR